jgi:prephenate dehydrogenase
VARRAETARRALRMGIVSAATLDPAAVSDADVVVLATPVRTLLRQIPEFAPRVRPGAILTDVGSTKAEIVAELRRSAPGAVVVAGHPMAGNERAGLDGCDERLFEGRPWVLIGRPRDGAILERLVRGVGSRPVWMKDPADHDLKVARVSHLPYLLAYALMGTPADAIRVCGSSFRDATRVAQSDPDMVVDFLLTNPRPIRRAASELVARLESLVRLIGRKDAAALRRALARARSLRARI